MPVQLPLPGTIADDFTQDQVLAQRDATLQDIAAIGGKWSGRVSLPQDDRLHNVGRALAALEPSLRELLLALVPMPGEDAAKAQAKAKLIAILNAALGAQDQGKDPSVFEAALLLCRLDRIAAERAIAARLRELAKEFDDDVLNTAAMVVEPGLKAIGVAQGLAQSNAEFRSLLAPSSNALSDMTKAARAAQAEARAKAKAADKAKTP